MKNKDGILRVGVLGCGRIFNHAHRWAYLETLGLGHLVAFYDPNTKRAEQTYADFRALMEAKASDSSLSPEQRELARQNLAEMKIYSSSTDLLTAVDSVDVCTTPLARLGCVVEAAEAGVHCMVEKPSARSWLEAERMREVTERHGVIFQLNDDNLWDLRYAMVRRILEGGAIGDVQSVWLTRGSQPFARTVLKWQATAEISGGGAVMDYGSHGIAALWYLLGMDQRVHPVRVESMEMAVRHRQRPLEGEDFTLQVEDDAHLKVLFEDNQTGSWRTAFLEASWSGNELGCVDHPYNQRLRVEGSRGVLSSFRNPANEEHLRIQCWAHSSYEGRETGPEEIVAVGKDSTEKGNHVRGIADFLRTIRDYLPPLASSSFAADVIAITGAAYLSHARGDRPVTLEEFKQHALAVRSRHADDRSAEDALIAEQMAPFRN